MRRLLAIVFVFAGLFISMHVYAASPASGTVSQANPTVSWTGGPLVPTAAGCAGPEDPTCDHFKLTIVPPPGGFTVKITLTPLDDWDLSVYDPSGSGEGSSGIPRGIAEIVELASIAVDVHMVWCAQCA